MQQALRFIAGVLGTVLVLSLITIFLLAMFVSPNRFKPIIAAEVKKTTGRDLVIDGNLAWSFYPSLGVQIGHAALKNPAGFKEPLFAEIDHATLRLKLLPLLQAQIQSNRVSLKGLKLYLIKTANGNNWEDLQPKSSSVTIKSRREREEELGSDLPINLDISFLDVTNAKISYTDEIAKQNYVISDLELHARKISLEKPFPITAKFNFAASEPLLAGQVNLQSQIVCDFPDRTYTLKNTYFSAKVNNVDFNAQGNIISNLAKQTVQIEDLTSQIAILSLSGKINITNINSDPQLNGRFEIHPVDVKAWLQSMGQTVDALQEMKDLSGTVDFSFNLPQVMTAQGKFKVNSLQAFQIKLSDVNLEMLYKNKILHLLPLTAKLYQGDMYSQVKIDLNGTDPHYYLQANLSHIAAEPLLDDLGANNKKIKFSGIGNVDLQLTTSGRDEPTLTRSLNGSGNLHFNDGELKGIDINYLIDSAYALAKQQEMTTSNSEKTTFGNLAGTINIHDGVITNNDAHFDAPRFNTTGKGTIDLYNRHIQFSLLTQVKKASSDQEDDLRNLYGIMLPIAISGDLENPTVRLDTENLLSALTKKQFHNVKLNVEAKLKDQIRDKAKNLLNDILGP